MASPMGDAPVVHVHYDRRRLGCGGCLLVIFAFVLLGNAKDWWREAETRIAEQRSRNEAEERRRNLAREIETFASQQAPELQRAVEELGSLADRHRERVKKLGDTLRSLGREPKADADYRRWVERLRKLEESRAELIRRREDAYLLWQKFVMSQDPAEKASYQGALDRGRQAAEGASDLLKKLLAESENGGVEPPR